MPVANELVHGTLDALILKTLSWGPRHGYAIARWLEDTTGDALQIEEGSLYPALYRMEGKGWIEAEWGISEKDRKSTRLNSSHPSISYAVFCLKKKNQSH